MDKSKLTELLDRVRDAAGPDRELDAQICVNLWPPMIMESWISVTPRTDLESNLWRSAGGGYVEHPNWWHPHGIGKSKAQEFTSSIDAALALTERVLPGWVYDFHSARRGTRSSAVVMEQKESRMIVAGEAETVPLSILAATLKALIALEAQE